MNWKARGRNHKRHKKHISFLCLLCFLWFLFPLVANSFTVSLTAATEKLPKNLRTRIVALCFVPSYDALTALQRQQTMR